MEILTLWIHAYVFWDNVIGACRLRALIYSIHGKMDTGFFCFA
jgi:hypothetical protein